MEQREKKFFDYKVYPVDRQLTRNWFVKYYAKDYVLGQLVPRKLEGDLNKYKTLEARDKEAERLIAGLEAGIELKNIGGKKIRPRSEAKGFADIVTLFKQMNKDLSYKVDARTYDNYVSKLRRFHYWCEITNRIDYPIGQMSVTDVRQFLSWLKQNEKLKNKTINDYKTLLGTLMEENIDKYDLPIKNPFRKIPCLKAESTHFKKHPQDLRLLIHNKLPEFDPLLYLFTQTIFNTLARCEEMRLMKRINIDFFEGIITVPATEGKTGVERTIILSKNLKKLFIDFEVDKLKPGQYVFGKFNHSEPVAYNYFRKRWILFRSTHNIPDVYKIYGLKHTGGRLLGKKFPAAMIQRQCGHGSMAETETYIDIEISDLYEMAENYADFLG